MSTAQSGTGQGYAYGYGRVGVLQQQLLGKSDIDKLLAAKDEAQIRQALGEIKLTAPVSPLQNLTQFVPAMEKWLKKELSRMVPAQNADVFEILWLREDLPVIAYLLKRFHHLTSEHSETPHQAVTAYDIDALTALILKGEHTADLPDELTEFVEQMKELKHPLPQDIDWKTAQFVAHRQVEVAEKSGSPLIRRYVAHLIDLQNIRTVRRLAEGSDPSGHLIKGGEIDVADFKTDPGHVVSLIRRSSIPNVVADSMLGDDHSSVALERSLNKALAHDIAEMRNLPLSLEPIFAFGVMALTQIYLIRSVLIGKTVGLTADEISEMLPPFFSTSYSHS